MFLIYSIDNKNYHSNNMIKFPKDIIKDFYQQDPYGSIIRLKVIKDLKDKPTNCIVFPESILKDTLWFYNPKEQLCILFFSFCKPTT